MIEKLKLKSGLEFEPGNVTIIVGPNNSGKSTFLNDIKFDLTQPNYGYDKIVIEEIEVNKFTEERAREFYKEQGREFIHPTNQQPQKSAQGNLFFKTSNGNFNLYNEHQIISALAYDNDRNTRYRLIEGVSTKVLDGNSRLSLFVPQTYRFITNKDDVLTNIEKLHENKDLREEFSKYVVDALGLYPEILPENGQGQITLMKEPLGEEQRDSHKKEVIDLLSLGKTQNDVSDGIKAFIGILLELVAGNPELILIDEVDAFLHAPLARKLGSIISGIAKGQNKQVFITTHNPHFIMGCIDSSSDFNILRLTYNNEIGEANIIDKEELKNIVKNPLLRSVGVFDGLFYKNVVVCEADSDRVFYQEINYRLREVGDKRKIDDCLFINARNKQTVGEITQVLRRFGIPTASIIDFDFIKDGGNVYTKYLEQNGIHSSMFNSLRESKASLMSYFKEHDDKWDKKNSKIKTQGLYFLDEGHKATGDMLLTNLNKFGLFPVPVGEVEAWLSNIEGGNHGNEWLVKKLENMGTPDSDDYIRPELGDVWNFIGDIQGWLTDSSRYGMKYD